MNWISFIALFIAIFFFFNSIVYKFPQLKGLVEFSNQISKIFDIIFAKFGIKLNNQLKILLNVFILTALIYSIIEKWYLFAIILIAFLILSWLI